MNPGTIRLQFRDGLCLLDFDRPGARNAINRALIEECHRALDLCLEREVNVLALRGSREAFCTGADFDELARGGEGGDGAEGARLYGLWARMTEEPFVTVAQVRGEVTGGGMGFVAACDLVLAEPSASFALPELLFGLFPACVLPFLTRRVGFQRAHYLTLTTKRLPAETAAEWGLVDDCGPDADELLRRHMLRLGRLSRAAVGRYKRYSAQMYGGLREWEPRAVAANREIFRDDENRRAIADYVAEGLFPWESRRGHR